jgi:hypothetical protein
MAAGTEKETPTLEMRLAAIEDKLARLTVTEEEMAAYTKVAALSGARGGAGMQPASLQSPGIFSDCWIQIRHCWIWNPPPHIWNITPINDCIPYPNSPASGPMGFSRLGR